MSDPTNQNGISSLLYQALLEGYDRTTFPFEQVGGPVDVDINMALQKILNINLQDGSMDLNVWLRLHWHDPRLTWNATEWNVTRIYVTNPELRYMDIWYPDVTLWNSGYDIASTLGPQAAIVYPGGDVHWGRNGMIKVSCNFKGLAAFPFGPVKCLMEFGTWSMGPLNVVVREAPQGGATIAGNSLTDMRGAKAVDWKFAGVKSWVHRYPAYPCCPEDSNWPVVLVDVTLHRTQTLYALKILVPQVILALVGFMTFWLSPECGERLGVAVTVPLALAVYDLLVYSTLPASDDISCIGAVGLLGFLFSCATLVINCLAIQLHHLREPTWWASAGAIWAVWVRFRQQQVWTRLLEVLDRLETELIKQHLAESNQAKKQRRGERTRRSSTTFKERRMSFLQLQAPRKGLTAGGGADQDFLDGHIEQGRSMFGAEGPRKSRRNSVDMQERVTSPARLAGLRISSVTGKIRLGSLGLVEDADPLADAPWGAESDAVASSGPLLSQRPSRSHQQPRASQSRLRFNFPRRDSEEEGVQEGDDAWGDPRHGRRTGTQLPALQHSTSSPEQRSFGEQHQGLQPRQALQRMQSQEQEARAVHRPQEVPQEPILPLGEDEELVPEPWADVRPRRAHGSMLGRTFKAQGGAQQDEMEQAGGEEGGTATLGTQFAEWYAAQMRDPRPARKARSSAPGEHSGLQPFDTEQGGVGDSMQVGPISEAEGLSADRMRAGGTGEPTPAEGAPWHGSLTLGELISTGELPPLPANFAGVSRQSTRLEASGPVDATQVEIHLAAQGSAPGGLHAAFAEPRDAGGSRLGGAAGSPNSDARYVRPPSRQLSQQQSPKASRQPSRQITHQCSGGLRASNEVAAGQAQQAASSPLRTQPAPNGGSPTRPLWSPSIGKKGPGGDSWIDLAIQLSEAEDLDNDTTTDGDNSLSGKQQPSQLQPSLLGPQRSQELPSTARLTGSVAMLTNATGMYSGQKTYLLEAETSERSKPSSGRAAEAGEEHVSPFRMPPPPLAPLPPPPPPPPPLPSSPPEPSLLPPRASFNNRPGPLRKGVSWSQHVQPTSPGETDEPSTGPAAESSTLRLAPAKGAPPGPKRGPALTSSKSLRATSGPVWNGAGSGSSRARMSLSAGGAAPSGTEAGSEQGMLATAASMESSLLEASSAFPAALQPRRTYTASRLQETSRAVSKDGPCGPAPAIADNTNGPTAAFKPHSGATPFAAAVTQAVAAANPDSNTADGDARIGVGAHTMLERWRKRLLGEKSTSLVEVHPTDTKAALGHSTSSLEQPLSSQFSGLAPAPLPLLQPVKQAFPSVSVDKSGTLAAHKSAPTGPSRIPAAVPPAWHSGDLPPESSAHQRPAHADRTSRRLLPTYDSKGRSGRQPGSFGGAGALSGLDNIEGSLGESAAPGYPESPAKPRHQTSMGGLGAEEAGDWSDGGGEEPADLTLDAVLHVGTPEVLESYLQMILENLSPDLLPIRERVANAVGVFGLEELVLRLWPIVGRPEAADTLASGPSYRASRAWRRARTTGGGRSGHHGGTGHVTGAKAGFHAMICQEYNLKWRLLSAFIDAICRYLLPIIYALSFILIIYLKVWGNTELQDGPSPERSALGLQS